MPLPRFLFGCCCAAAVEFCVWPSPPSALNPSGSAAEAAQYSAFSLPHTAGVCALPFAQGLFAACKAENTVLILAYGEGDAWMSNHKHHEVVEIQDLLHKASWTTPIASPDLNRKRGDPPHNDSLAAPLYQPLYQGGGSSDGIGEAGSGDGGDAGDFFLVGPALTGLIVGIVLASMALLLAACWMGWGRSRCGVGRLAMRGACRSGTKADSEAAQPVQDGSATDSATAAGDGEGDGAEEKAASG